jgi:hypothetical protein
MNETQLKAIGKNFFRKFGIELKDIPKTSIQTPDFEFALGNEKYTIELKIKGDDLEDVQGQVSQLKKKKIIAKLIPIAPRNRLSGIIRDGVGQLSSYDPDKKTYRVLWLHCDGQKPKIHWERFHSTIYGTETLVSRGFSLIRCYYFYESAFYKWRNELDVVLLTTLHELQLCINTISPRVGEIRASQLVHYLSDALCDPNREETLGAIIADCNIDRSKESEILEYLKKKYKLDNLQKIPLTSYSGTVLMDEKSFRRNERVFKMS